MAQYIFTMNRVSKIVPPKGRSCVTYHSFPGAKIGARPERFGKSAVAGSWPASIIEIDERRPQPGIKIGYLPQEPELTRTSDARQRRGEALIRAAMTELNALCGEVRVTGWTMTR